MEACLLLNFFVCLHSQLISLHTTDVWKVWSGIRIKYINFQNILPSIKHILFFRTYIIKFSKHILAYTKHILILRTYILKFFKQLLALTKHMLILRTDNNCFLKQVLIFPCRCYLRYRCLELVIKNYHASNKAGSRTKHIIFKILLDKVKWK